MKNEPAFPSEENIEGDSYNSIPDTKHHYPGITKLDYFAAKAMQGMLANSTILKMLEMGCKDFDPSSAGSLSLLGTASYDIAESMLTELKRR